MCLKLKYYMIFKKMKTPTKQRHTSLSSQPIPIVCSFNAANVYVTDAYVHHWTEAGPGFNSVSQEIRKSMSDHAKASNIPKSSTEVHMFVLLPIPQNK